MLYLHNWTSRKKWLAHVISCHAQDYMTSRPKPKPLCLSV